MQANKSSLSSHWGLVRLINISNKFGLGRVTIWKAKKSVERIYLEKRKLKGISCFQYTLVQMRLINLNKAFKAGPARTAVFQVSGALDSKAHRSGRGVGGGRLHARYNDSSCYKNATISIKERIIHFSRTSLKFLSLSSGFSACRTLQEGLCGIFATMCRAKTFLPFRISSAR